MTFVGKILVVVQVALSLMFMAFAGAVYTAQTNWKDALTASQTKIESMTTEAQNASAAFDTLKKDSESNIKEAGDRADVAEARVMQLTQNLQSTEGENARLKAERDAAFEESRIASEEANARIAESNELRDIVAKARAKIVEQVESIRSQQDEILSRDRKINAADLKQTGLLDDMARMERLLRVNDIDPDTPSAIDVLAPPPPLDGLVKDTRYNRTRSTEFVHLSLGHDDGLRVNHKVWVTRADQFLALVRVVDVRPDECVAVVIERARNGTIKRGDNVTSRL